VRFTLNNALAGLRDIIPPVQRFDLLQRASIQMSARLPSSDASLFNQWLPANERQELEAGTPKVVSRRNTTFDPAMLF
jgi:hypothetical protein